MFYFKDKVILTYVVYEKQRIGLRRKLRKIPGSLCDKCLNKYLLFHVTYYC